MKILLISPLVKPINSETKYAGIELLVYQYAQELSKEHQVTVQAHNDSVFPADVKLFPVKPVGDSFTEAELRGFQEYQHLYRGFDAIHDFSHAHLAARFTVSLPAVSLFWHAPAVAQYPKAPYGIIGLSHWACREFKRVYHQEARYQQSIVIDPDTYKPSGERGDRFLTLGIMSPQKGNLSAIQLCLAANVPLDVVGGREVQPGQPETEYEKAIHAGCDGKQIRFLGEVSHEEKIKLLQSCRGLIYATGYPEVTSHKIQEAMLCGAPVIVPRVGGIPEIVTHGVDGFLCGVEKEYMEAIRNVDKLTPLTTREANARKYSVKEVCAQYVELYQQVKDGLKW